MIVSGIALYSYFWNLYVIHLALKLFYPMKSDKLFKSDHSRKIFIAEVLIVFLIGTIPSILIATVGPNYKIATFPPIYCGNDGIYLLILSVVPNLIIGFVSHTLILLILYKLHIVSLTVCIANCNIVHFICKAYGPAYYVVFKYLAY